MAGFVHAHALVGGLALASLLTGCEAAESMEPGGTGTTGDTAAPDSEPPMARDACPSAPRIGAGRWGGTLQDASGDLGGACGRGGPDAFFMLELSHTSDVRIEARGRGFEPRIGVLDDGCFAEWERSQLLCAEGHAGWIPDLAAGSRLVLAIGIDPEHLPLPQQSEDEGDPLAFVVDVAVRRILSAGQRCRPLALGRCASGTTCREQPTGVWTCTPVPADTCAMAQRVVLQRGQQRLDIDPAVPQTDAHHHSCTGRRMRERVFELELPPSLPSGTELTIEAVAPDVGLAVRASGCGIVDEVACRHETSGESRLVLDSALVGVHTLWLFVELPGLDEAEAGGEPPFPVNLRLSAP